MLPTHRLQTLVVLTKGKLFCQKGSDPTGLLREFVQEGFTQNGEPHNLPSLNILNGLAELELHHLRLKRPHRPLVVPLPLVCLTRRELAAISEALTAQYLS